VATERSSLRHHYKIIRFQKQKGTSSVFRSDEILKDPSWSVYSIACGESTGLFSPATPAWIRHTQLTRTRYVAAVEKTRAIVVGTVRS
jgi:hypothetical protein